MAADFRIVSLCGSAGALPSYIEFLQLVPKNSGMAFVVLTHRRAGNPCWLVQILSRITSMLVEEIKDGTLLRPNCVYVIPAGQNLTTDGSTFMLSPAPVRDGVPNTFDLFLRSVARSTLKRAFTVILSGEATDGCVALAELRSNGGTNYAESGARFSSMSDSAIRTGEVEFVGSPAEIVAAIFTQVSPAVRRWPVGTDI